MPSHTLESVESIIARQQAASPALAGKESKLFLETALRPIRRARRERFMRALPLLRRAGLGVGALAGSRFFQTEALAETEAVKDIGARAGLSRVGRVRELQDFRRRAAERLALLRERQTFAKEQLATRIAAAQPGRRRFGFEQLIGPATQFATEASLRRFFPQRVTF